MRRALGLAFLVPVLMAGSVAPAAGGPNDDDRRYDEHFRKYSKRFFGIAFDWRLFKAQGLAESNLRPEAASGRGARGVMQLMPATYRDIQLRNPELGDIGHPEWNIAAGIWYAKQLWNSWNEEIDRAHHRDFMLASYNAGRATVLRARRIAESLQLNPRLWPSIAQVAPNVPRWAYRETLGYIDKVTVYLRSMDRRGRLVTTTRESTRE